MPSNGLPLKREMGFPPIYPTKTSFVGFSDYRFILSLVLLVLVGLMAIPIGGLTAFHVYLIAQGRTTNEQVTGKYRIQNDIFNRGCWTNVTSAFCQPLYPRLRSAKKKRYDVDLFEQMAYGKMKYKLGNNGSDQQKKVAVESNGKIAVRPHIHVNPVDEIGKSLRTPGQQGGKIARLRTEIDVLL